MTVAIPGLPDDAVPLRMVRFSPGTFLKGSPDDEKGRKPFEGPQHEVTIRDPFFIGESEVTQAQWKAVIGALPKDMWKDNRGRGDNHPVYHVSWNDISETGGFLDRINEIAWGTFRLPTESEWDYACRAGSLPRYSYGDGRVKLEGCDKDADLSVYAWFCGNTNFTRPVRTRRPNAMGLYDMHGNVGEWVQDLFGDYALTPTDGTAHQEDPTQTNRVIRGGSWNEGARFNRTAARMHYPPDKRNAQWGFRVEWKPD